MKQVSNQLWTQDMVIGASMAIIGMIALLAKSNFISVTVHFAIPAAIVLWWPLLIVAVGVILLPRTRSGRVSRLESQKVHPEL